MADRVINMVLGRKCCWDVETRNCLQLGSPQCCCARQSVCMCHCTAITQGEITLHHDHLLLKTLHHSLSCPVTCVVLTVSCDLCCWSALCVGNLRSKGLSL
eukprot:5878-Rhodomonas_salina.1